MSNKIQSKQTKIDLVKNASGDRVITPAMISTPLTELNEDKLEKDLSNVNIREFLNNLNEEDLILLQNKIKSNNSKVIRFSVSNRMRLFNYVEDILFREDGEIRRISKKSIVNNIDFGSYENHILTYNVKNDSLLSINSEDYPNNYLLVSYKYKEFIIGKNLNNSVNIDLKDYNKGDKENTILQNSHVGVFFFDNDLLENSTFNVNFINTEGFNISLGVDLGKDVTPFWSVVKEGENNVLTSSNGECLLRLYKSTGFEDGKEFVIKDSSQKVLAKITKDDYMRGSSTISLTDSDVIFEYRDIVIEEAPFTLNLVIEDNTNIFEGKNLQFYSLKNIDVNKMTEGMVSLVQGDNQLTLDPSSRVIYLLPLSNRIENPATVNIIVKDADTQEELARDSFDAQRGGTDGTYVYGFSFQAPTHGKVKIVIENT